MEYVRDLKSIQPGVRCRIFYEKTFKLVFILYFPQDCSSSKWEEGKGLPGYAGLIPWVRCLLVLKKLLWWEVNLIYFSYIRDRRIWDIHLSLIQTSLNIQGSEGKPFCSTSCNQNPIAMAAWQNGLEPFTFGDACRYICTSLKLEEKVIFSCDITCIGCRNKEGTFTLLCMITFPVLPFS